MLVECFVMSGIIRKTIYLEPHQSDWLARRWKELKRSMLKRMMIKIPQTGRTWTRDEPYEGRLNRF